jgi:hypothetical protein
MTQHIERTHAQDARVEAPVAPENAPIGSPRDSRPPPAGPRSWWRRPWMIPLWIVLAAFLIYELPPYVGLDSSTSRIIVQKGFPPHYALLIAHIGMGTVALLTVGLQVWPWLRQHHPAIHRSSGRVYVVAASVAALTALTIMPFAVGGKIGITMHAVLWLGATVTGFWMVRQHRYVEHRRWMLRSFALALGVPWGLATVIIWPYLPFKADISLLFEMARWFGWVINLIIVQLWLDHTQRRPVVQQAQLLS